MKTTLRKCLSTAAMLIALAQANSAWAGPEIYGGVAAPMTYNDSYSGNIQVDAGYSLGAGAYYQFNDNFELGADLMHNNQDLPDLSAKALYTLSLALNGRAIKPIRPDLDAYFGGGAGVMVSACEYGLFCMGLAPVLQAEAGLRFQLPSTQAFTAIKFQKPIQTSTLGGMSDDQKHLSLIFGLSF